MNLDERIAALDDAIGVAETALVDASLAYQAAMCSDMSDEAVRAKRDTQDAARDHLNALIDERLDETSIQRAGWSVVEKDGDGEDLG